MIINNVRIFTPDGAWLWGTVETQNDRIAAVVSDREYTGSGQEVVDGEGLLLIPGYIDMHFHGCMGADVCDGSLEALKTIADHELSVGVTTISPATMTIETKELLNVLRVIGQFEKAQRKDHKGARLAGINMEGPFISAVKCGAQDPGYILPADPELFFEFMEASGGLVKFIGVAPEKDKALEFIDRVRKKVCVTLAHTDATYEEAKAAIDHGAEHVVHLYNAMRPFLSREPGVVGAAAERDKVTAELICDGIHVHPAVVRDTFRMFSKDRMILISDSMRATDLSDGRYTLGGQEVEVKGNRAVLVKDGAIAGSVTNLADCVKNAVVNIKLPKETAILAATRNPAVRLGIAGEVGTIEAGRLADLLLLDDDMNVKRVMKEGHFI